MSCDEQQSPFDRHTPSKRPTLSLMPAQLVALTHNFIHKTRQTCDGFTGLIQLKLRRISTVSTRPPQIVVSSNHLVLFRPV